MAVSEELVQDFFEICEDGSSLENNGIPAAREILESLAEDEVKTLLSQIVDNNSALELVAIDGNTSLAKLLVQEYHADINVHNGGALRWATYFDNTGVLEILSMSARDASPEALGKEALRAVRRRSEDVLRSLLAQDADISLNNFEIVALAAEKTYIRDGVPVIIDMLRRAGAPMNVLDNLPIKWSVMNDDPVTFDYLAKHGAKIDFDSEPELVRFASKFPTSTMLERLEREGVDVLLGVDDVEEIGMKNAVRYGLSEIFDFYLYRGAALDASLYMQAMTHSQKKMMSRIKDLGPLYTVMEDLGVGRHEFKAVYETAERLELTADELYVCLDHSVVRREIVSDTILDRADLEELLPDLKARTKSYNEYRVKKAREELKAAREKAEKGQESLSPISPVPKGFKN